MSAVDDVTHRLRDDVLGALSLVEATIGSPAVQGADAVRLCAAASALRRANNELRSEPTAFEQAGEVIPFPGFSVKVV